MKRFSRIVPVWGWLILGLLTSCNLSTGLSPSATDAALATESESAAGATQTAIAQAASTSEDEEGVEAESILKEVNPLTGLSVPAEQLEHRPVAVKITNYPRSSRPQWGLSFADIVYEYYHNNELTRFHAIFYGEDAELAGPIRSGRLFDDYLTDMYGSALVFASADYRVLDRLRTEHPAWQTIFLLEGDCPPTPVCRYEPDTHNYLLADTAEISVYSEGLEGTDFSPPLLSGMSFSAQAPSQGTGGERIYLRYSYSAYSYWQYEPVSELYTRYQDTREDLGGAGEGFRVLTDRLNDGAIRAANIVVLLMPHSHFYYRPASGDTPASEIVDMEFLGRGQAFAFRDGMAYPLEWVNDGEQILHLENSDGEDFPLKPGTTWFQVMTDDSFYEVDGNSWRFNFVFAQP